MLLNNPIQEATIVLIEPLDWPQASRFLTIHKAQQLEEEEMQDRRILRKQG